MRPGRALDADQADAAGAERRPGARRSRASGSRGRGRGRPRARSCRPRPASPRRRSRSVITRAPAPPGSARAGCGSAPACRRRARTGCRARAPRAAPRGAPARPACRTTNISCARRRPIRHGKHLPQLSSAPKWSRCLRDVAHVGAVVEADDPAVADHAALRGQRLEVEHGVEPRGGEDPAERAADLHRLHRAAVAHAAGHVLAQLAHGHPERDLVDAPGRSKRSLKQTSFVPAVASGLSAR